PVTADELWRALPGERDDCVHLATFPAGLEAFVDAELAGRWSKLLAVRDAVLPRIEEMRQQKAVGQSLEAHVQLRASGELYALLEAHRDDLPMLCITSSVTVSRGEGDEPLRVEVTRAGGDKCVRCWRYVPQLAADDTHAGLCPRCVTAVQAPAGAGPARGTA
nr:hypothetical protein [Vicinamibacterales bacterium]